jgi:hypothetical protein
LSYRPAPPSIAALPSIETAVTWKRRRDERFVAASRAQPKPTRLIAMEPRIIKTKSEYQSFRAEVERLLAQDPDVDPDSEDGRRLELLAKLVEYYEKEHFRFRKPDPVEAIEFRMEQQGRK